MAPLPEVAAGLEALRARLHQSLVMSFRIGSAFVALETMK
jgi:hypothetical protein